MQFIKLKAAKQHITKKGGRQLDLSLNLTPMIDMFVVLVIFLLMTFSTSGDILFIQKDIELPKATQTDTLDQAPVVTIGAGQVVIEGQAVGRMDDIAEDENFEIADLSERLTNLKKNYQTLHPNKEFPAKIIIQGHKEIPFRVLKKVMFTCTASGYNNINFAVLPVGGAKKPPEGEGAAAEGGE